MTTAQLFSRLRVCTVVVLAALLGLTSLAAATVYCDGTLTGTHNSDVYVNGTTCHLQDATVHGSLLVRNGGHVFSVRTVVSKNVLLQASGYVSLGSGTVVYGAVNGYSGESSLRVCGATVYQSVGLSSWAGNVEIHGTAGSCDGTAVYSGVTAFGASGTEEFVLRDVAQPVSSLLVEGFGYVELSGATVSGGAIVRNNAFVRGSGLTVRGTAIVDGNKGMMVSDSSFSTLVCLTFDDDTYRFTGVSVSDAQQLCSGKF